MMTRILVLLWTFLHLTFAAPQAAQIGSDEVQADTTVTSTISATLSFTFTSTQVVTLPTLTTSSTASKPTYTATQVYAFRPNSPIHLLPFQAAGYVLRLGDHNAAYCPTFAEAAGACTMHTNITGINDCSLLAIVPGGQAIYLAPDGSLRYTPPHSQYVMPGSILCPLSFTPVRDSDASKVMVAGFGATTFMACPMLSNKNIKQHWQVYANTLNASVPLRQGNSSSCWTFEAVGIEKEVTLPAWQYV